MSQLTFEEKQLIFSMACTTHYHRGIYSTEYNLLRKLYYNSTKEEQNVLEDTCTPLVNAIKNLGE